MESTEENRVWRNGPPPHVGWWNASIFQDDKMWRWWNGIFWSTSVRFTATRAYAAECSSNESPSSFAVKWTDYYPSNARVERIAP